MIELLNANALHIPLAGESVQCVVTSPPYFSLRDYGVDNQIGQEETPAQYVAHLVDVFAEVYRVLRDDGTLWLNLGDSYAGGNGNGGVGPKSAKQTTNKGSYFGPIDRGKTETTSRWGGGDRKIDGLRPKNLIGIPWRIAFALQDFGWYLRSDIVWSKSNPMPESVTDRPTKSHEYIFLLTKSSKYYYDCEAIKEPGALASEERLLRGVSDHHKNINGVPGQTPHSMNKPRDKQRGHGRRHAGFNDRWDAMTRAEQCSAMRNKRSVWNVATYPYSGAHFATFPPALIEPMIKAGSRPGDIVFDPFVGSGTTLQVARALGRSGFGADLSLTYLRECARVRLSETALYEWQNGPSPSVDNLAGLPMFETAL